MSHQVIVNQIFMQTTHEFFIIPFLKSHPIIHPRIIDKPINATKFFNYCLHRLFRASRIRQFSHHLTGFSPG